ncbi:MAG: T9SS C-terminal target domain-containing protein, partial [Flavobacteriales bacterium]
LSQAALPQPNFSVFPNPSQGHHDIALSELTPNTFCRIELFDLRGNLVKQVFSGHSKSSRLEIRVDLSDFPAGSYFYRVQTEAGVSQKKVVVY